MVCDIGHPSWMTFLTSVPNIQERGCRSDHQIFFQDMNRSILQHPTSKNITSGRLFTNSRTRGYAGTMEAWTFAGPNRQMHRSERRAQRYRQVRLDQHTNRQVLTLYASSCTSITCFFNSSVSWIPISALKNASSSGPNSNKVLSKRKERRLVSFSLSRTRGVAGGGFRRGWQKENVTDFIG